MGSGGVPDGGPECRPGPTETGLGRGATPDWDVPAGAATRGAPWWNSDAGGCRAGRGATRYMRLPSVVVPMSDRSLPDDLREALVSATRTVVGDELRSITYFTEDTVEQVYLREDLEADADLVGFADTERLGFRSQMDYRDTELGEYQFTIRVFEHGYLTRVIVDDRGVFVTTDPMPRDRFEELATALRSTLHETDDDSGG